MPVQMGLERARHGPGETHLRRGLVLLSEVQHRKQCAAAGWKIWQSCHGHPLQAKRVSMYVLVGNASLTMGQAGVRGCT